MAASDALNPPIRILAAVQFYALGVPSKTDGVLDVYVAVAAPPEHLPAIAKGSGKCNSGFAARVAEAVILESLIHWQRKANLVQPDPLPLCSDSSFQMRIFTSGTPL